MKPIDAVLTSDLFHYFVGQGAFWLVIAVGAAVMFRHRRQSWGVRIAFAAALGFAVMSSFMPLLVRWLASDPGLGGPDAAAEETIFSFFATLPQAAAVALLMWVAFRNPASIARYNASTSPLA